MVTFTIIWSIVVAVVFAADLFLELWRRIGPAAKPVPMATLEQNVAKADEYEIAFLKGGEYLTRMMALRHLVRSGYFEKAGETLVPDTEKDRSSLTDFERAMLATPIRTEYGSFLSSKEETAVKRIVDGYAQKARELNLFVKGQSIAARTAMFLLLVVVYVLSGVSLDERAQVAIGVLIVVTGVLLLWKKKTYRPASIMVAGKTGGPATRQVLSDHVLTRNGREYIALFEKTHYPVDERLAEALGTCPCSLLD